MNELIMLHGVKPREILQDAVDKNIPLVMSYLAGHKWQLARVLLTDIRTDGLDVRISPQKKSHPVDIQVGQSVGMSLKYGYGVEYDNFIFSTTVVALKSSSDPAGDERIALAMPEEIELVHKQSYMPVKVPESLQVNVELWRRDYVDDYDQLSSQRHWQGRLLDISADSLHIIIDAAQRPDFERRESVGLRFNPVPHETPLTFNAQVKEIMLTPDSANLCLRLQMVGLEASPEGRLILQRLCNVVEQYRRLAHTPAEQKNTHTINL